jgi:type I restriction enzyme S subunit
MNRWPTTSLGDLVSTVTKGTTPQTLGRPYTVEGIPFLRAENLQGGRLVVDGGTLRIDQETHRLLARSVIRPNDVLLSIAGTIGRASIVGEDAAEMNCNQAVGIIRLVPGHILPAFLLAWLKTAEAQRQMTGAQVTQTVSNLSLGQIRKLRLPVPPLPEQERIVKLLDEAGELRKLRARADRLTAALIPALFNEMFGDLAVNSGQWELTGISEMAEVQGGLQLTPARDTYSLKRPYLRVANVQRGFLVLDEIKEIGLLDSEYERTKLAKGDLLLVEGNGNPREIGRAAIWDGSIADCVHQNHLIRVRPRSDSLNSEYLVAFVNSESGRNYFHGSGNTTSGLVTISTSVVKSCRIPVPPLPLQEEFAERVTEIRAVQAGQTVTCQRLEALFQSMLHRAFAGEL